MTMRDSRLTGVSAFKELHELYESLRELGADVGFWEAQGGAGTYKPETLAKVEDLISEGDVELAWPAIAAYERLHYEQPDIKKALSSYQAAVDEAPGPSTHAELGYLLLRRAKVEPAPLGAFDLEDSKTQLDEHLAPGPTLPGGARSELIKLALDAYGRAYGNNVYFLGLDNPEDEIHPWQQIFVLDGLRVIFREMDLLDLEELACHIYDDWTRAMDRDFYEDPDAWRFERRFGETRGIILGRLVRDPANRDAARQRIAAELGELMNELPRSACQYLVSAEILAKVLDMKGDWAPVVNEYSKAVESLLKDRIGHYLDDNPHKPLALLLRNAINGNKRHEVRRFSRLSLSTFKDALERVTSQLADKRLRPLANDLVKLVPLRTKATHAGEAWKVFYEQAETVQDLCMRVEPPGLVRLLAELKL